MTIEVRYIIFTPEEARQAIVAFVLKENHTPTPDDILAMKMNGSGHATLSVEVRIRRAIADKTVTISSESLIGALLIYCNERRIPIPRRAQKSVEASVDGLTLVLTTDIPQKQPAVKYNHITYSNITNYEQEAREVKQEMALAIERAETARNLTTVANAKVLEAKSSAYESIAQLMAIARVPGLRGRLGRWLLACPAGLADAPAPNRVQVRRSRV